MASRGGLPHEGLLPALEGLPVPLEVPPPGPCRAPMREEGREPWLRVAGMEGTG